jgi:hypothetical protein
MKIKLNTKYINEEVELVLNEYSTMKGALRIDALDPRTGEPIATPTSFMRHETPLLDPNVVMIKSYSENEGMVEGLIKAGIGHIDNCLISEVPNMHPFRITHPELLKEIDKKFYAHPSN